jgi:glutamyl-Q tRNA(Asp) synthetase
MSASNRPYCGRFAPTPSGPLHFGSLVTALASFLHAKKRQGRWLVRIEDVDTTRVMPGAAAEILRQLESASLHWDGEVVYQSKRSLIYQEMLESLFSKGELFSCSCTRSRLQETGERAADGSPLYPGTCRLSRDCLQPEKAVRLRVNNAALGWDDSYLGYFEQNLERDVGDFVLRRADGCYTYHLAVVVDDELQDVTTVVRGSDLLDSTPRQIYLQTLLGFRHLSYAHLPLVLNEQGEKLSKQTRSPKVERATMTLELWRALRFLGQPIPDEMRHAATRVIVEWAMANWNEDAIPRLPGLPFLETIKAT